jgi:nuclear transport factor 2 (NTF2) superfamily protein
MFKLTPMSESIARVAADSTHLAVPSQRRAKRFTQSVIMRKTDEEVDRIRDNDFVNIENIHHFITKAFNQELDYR